ncbi:MAG: type II 3-dehydroquinate dehydratase [bacterium]
MIVHVYHGPNLNKLKDRDSDHYGTRSLEAINGSLRSLSEEFDVDVECRQTNHEGELVEWIQNEEKDGLVLNAAAYTHTSVAVRDAIEMVDYPVVEVHLSNIYAREDFREESRISSVCQGVISGFGQASYTLGLRAVIEHLQS